VNAGSVGEGAARVRARQRWRSINSDQAARRGSPIRSGPTEPRDRLVSALDAVRTAVAPAAFPLALNSAAPARSMAAAVVAQIDDYLVPRWRRLDAPLLAVVGGPTGAGKSTLVNSLVRAPVSRAGALRPTTRSPLVVCHPANAPWFASNELLPGLIRRTGAGADTQARLPRPDAGALPEPPPDPGTALLVPHDWSPPPARSRDRAESTEVAVLHLISAPELVPGLALLDAPDIDSVVESNRALAHEVFAAADLWIFVTTASRYADAVPWAVLAAALQRGTPVAVVLDRVPVPVLSSVVDHLTTMLRDNGLAEAPLFVLAESALDRHGLLPEHSVAPLKRWIDAIARDQPRRAATARWTLLGAARSLRPVLDRLVDAAEDQISTVAALARQVEDRYAAALDRLEASLSGGYAWRGEVLSRWRELVDGGELRRLIRADRHPGGAAADPPGRLVEALTAGLTALVQDAAEQAAEQCAAAWLASSAGRALAEVQPWLDRAAPDLAAQAAELVRRWRDVIRSASARAYSAGAGATGEASDRGELLLMIAIGAPAELPGAAGGLLAAARTDRHIAGLIEPARRQLIALAASLLATGAARYTATLVALAVDGRTPDRLRTSASRLASAVAALDPDRSGAAGSGDSVASEGRA
jgi:Dynamin family